MADYSTISDAGALLIERILVFQGISILIPSVVAFDKLVLSFSTRKIIQLDGGDEFILGDMIFGQ